MALPSRRRGVIARMQFRVVEQHFTCPRPRSWPNSPTCRETTHKSSQTHAVLQGILTIQAEEKQGLYPRLCPHPLNTPLITT